MTTNLIDHSPAVVAAIREAFHDASPCHCQSSDGKLSAKELLDAMVRHRHVHYADLDNLECLPIRDLKVQGSHNDPTWELYRQEIHYLPELTAWSYAELLRIPNIGPAKADAIEALMAKYGLMLRDGNPRRLAELQEEEPEPESRHIEGTPKEIRETVSKDLVTIAQRLMSHNATMMKQAIRIVAGEKVAGTLGKTLRCSERAYRESRRLVQPLRDLEEREAAPRKAKPRRYRASAKPAPRVEHRGVVVRGAFPQAAGGGAS